MNTAHFRRNTKPAPGRERLDDEGLALRLCHVVASSPGFELFGQNLESHPPLPKDHSQSAQDLVKKTTLNPGTGGSNEKAISRKRSARRVGLGDAGGIRCRYAGCASTRGAPGL